MEAWNDLPADLKPMVEVACHGANRMAPNEFVARNGSSLQSLKDDHSVDIRRFSDVILETLATLSVDVIEETIGDDMPSRETHGSIKAFRISASAWSASPTSPTCKPANFHHPGSSVPDARMVPVASLLS